MISILTIALDSWRDALRSRCLLEVSPAGVSKGETLSMLLPRLGIELEEMLAIGENCFASPHSCLVDELVAHLEQLLTLADCTTGAYRRRFK